MKKNVLILVSLFLGTAHASTIIDVSCSLSRISTVSRLQTEMTLRVVDDGAIACGATSAVNMEICYAGDVGNFVMRAFNSENKLVNSVVSKYGSFTAIPEKFELSSQVGSDLSEREMFIASCHKR